MTRSQALSPPLPVQEDLFVQKDLLALQAGAQFDFGY
jgi:hypothetical protein